MSQIDRIRDKLAEVRRRGLETFGSGSHRYELGPPLDERAVRAFEVERGVTLPDAYRSFLTEVGHSGPGAYGGAGPYYGLYALDAWDDFAGWVADEVPPDWLARPSRLVPGPNELPDWPDDADDTPDELIAAYEGVLTIGSRGCTYSTGLVVTGEARGRVVYLDADHHERPYVCRDADFLDWYERWLDELLGGYQSSWFGYGPAGGEATLVDIAVGSPDPVLRREALNNLHKLPDLGDAAWDALARLVRDSDTTIRTAAAGVLAKAPPERVELVAPLLHDESAEVRRNACRAVMKLAPERFEQEIWDALLASDDGAFHEAAFFALRDAGFIDADRALTIISDERLRTISSSAAYQFAWQPEHQELLRRLLRDPMQNLRMIAIGAAQRLELRDLAADALAQFDVETEDHLRKMLMRLFVTFDEHRANGAMLEIARTGDDFQRLAAAHALSDLGDERVEPVLVELLALDRTPSTTSSGHSRKFPDLVREFLERSPSPKLRALGKVS